MNAEAEAQEAVARQLDLLSKTSLKTVGDLLGFGPPAGERGDELRTIAGAVGTPAHLSRLERVLTPADWALLNLLPLQLGPFQIVSLLGPLRRWGMNAQQSLETISKLLACAAILPVNTSRAQAKLTIDSDQIRNWASSAWLELAPGVEGWADGRAWLADRLQAVEPPSDVASSALPELRRIAFLLLGEAKRKPIRLTSAGTPNKTDLRRLAAALGMMNETSGTGQVVTPIPDLLYLALAALAGARLLQSTGSELRPAPASTEFFIASAEVQAAALLNAWSVSRFDDFACIPTLYRQSEDRGAWMRTDVTWVLPNDERISLARLAIPRAMAKLLHDDPRAWHRIDDVAKFIREQFPELLFAEYEPYRLLYDISRVGRYGESPRRRERYPGIYRRRPDTVALGSAVLRDSALYQDSDWMEVEGAFIRQVLAGAMRYLGLTEVGPGSVTPECFRLTELGEALLLGRPFDTVETGSRGRAAIVQPNFEVVVVDAAANFGLLAQLDAFAERRSLDRAATYQLTQPALVRGLDQGWSGDGILTALESANDGQLPQNVRYSLKQWIQRYESVTLRELSTVLEVDEPAQLDRMLSDSRLAPLFGDRLGPTMALVPADHLGEFLSACQDVGGLRTVDLESERAGTIRIREPDTIELRDEADEPYVRYRLDALADRAADVGGRHSYRMTPETVQRAIAAGWTGDQLAVLLEQLSGDDLPAEFLVRLLGWSGAAQDLIADHLIAVQAGEAGLDWELLQRIPDFHGLVRGLLGPSVALVAAGDVGTLRTELARRGLSLREGTLPNAALASQIPVHMLQEALEQYWEGPQAIRRALQSSGLVAKPKPRRRLQR